MDSPLEKLKQLFGRIQFPELASLLDAPPVETTEAKSADTGSSAKDVVRAGLQASLPQILQTTGSNEVTQLEEAFREISARKGGADEFSLMQDGVWLEQVLPVACKALSSDFDYGRDSLQKRLVEHLSIRHPEVGLLRIFQAAKRTQDEAIRDLACLALTGRSHKKIRPALKRGATAHLAVIGSPRATSELQKETVFSSDPRQVSTIPKPLNAREFGFIRLAALLPDKVFSSPAFIEMVNMALQRGRGEVLNHTLAKERAAALKRDSSLGLKEVRIVMTLHWTDPDFPLWLASEAALTKILTHYFRVSDVETDKAVGKMRERYLKSKRPLEFWLIENFKTLVNRRFVIVPNSRLPEDLKSGTFWSGICPS